MAPVTLEANVSLMEQFDDNRTSKTSVLESTGSDKSLEDRSKFDEKSILTRENYSSDSPLVSTDSSDHPVTILNRAQSSSLTRNNILRTDESLGTGVDVETYGTSRHPEEESRVKSTPEIIDDPLSLKKSAQGSKITEKSTAIQGIASRRTRTQTSSDSDLIDKKISLLVPKSTRDLVSTSNPTISSGSSKRLTMANFLRDTGVGIPMSNVASGESSNRSQSPQQASTETKRIISVTDRTSAPLFPQLRATADGRIVIDDPAGAAEANLAASSESIITTVINEPTKRLTSHAFVKSIGPNRWSREDTEKFYNALSMVGTDFAILSLFFPKRSREQIKGKYGVEEKTNPNRITAALANKRPIDREWLAQAQAERELILSTVTSVSGSSSRLSSIENIGSSSPPRSPMQHIVTSGQQSPSSSKFDARRPGRPKQNVDYISTMLTPTSPPKNPNKSGNLSISGSPRKQANLSSVGNSSISGSPRKQPTSSPSASKSSGTIKVDYSLK